MFYKNKDSIDKMQILCQIKIGKFPNLPTPVLNFIYGFKSEITF